MIPKVGKSWLQPILSALVGNRRGMDDACLVCKIVRRIKTDMPLAENTG